MSSDIKARAARFVEKHNQADYMQTFDELLTPDVKVHEYLPGLPEPMDRNVYTAFIAGFRDALPDVRNAVDDVFSDGDRVAVRWHASGTHTGEPLMGIAAKGKAVQAHGIYILRFEGDRIAEIWNNWDNANVMQQLS